MNCPNCGEELMLDENVNNLGDTAVCEKCLNIYKLNFDEGGFFLEFDGGTETAYMKEME